MISARRCFTCAFEDGAEAGAGVLAQPFNKTSASARAQSESREAILIMHLESGGTGSLPVPCGNLPHGMEGDLSAPKHAPVAPFWRAGSPPGRAGCPCHPWFELHCSG